MPSYEKELTPDGNRRRRVVPAFIERPMTMRRHWMLAVILLAVVAGASLRVHAQAPVTYERLLNAAKEPHNYLTYGGDYSSTRYSTLTQITPANVKNLNLAWVYQASVTGSWQPTPLVVDGIMYLTQRPNDVIALDATTGRVFWIYRYTQRGRDRVLRIEQSRRRDTRRAALHGHARRPPRRHRCEKRPAGVEDASRRQQGGIFDYRLAARVEGPHRRRRGRRRIWHPRIHHRVRRADRQGDVAVLHDSGSGRAGARDVGSVPAESEDAIAIPEAWKHGGASVWVTGSFDPELNLTYWGIGNAGPDYNADQRPGDNLYTASVVALDADTGKLRWHYQFTPHDHYDYDSVQVPVLADITWQGAPVKAMFWANRNGNFYVLDRATGKFLHAKPFVKSELDERLRRQRPAHSNAAAGGTADISGHPGRHELVLAVLQPANEADVRVDVGIRTPTSSAARRSSTSRGVASPAATIKRSCRRRASRRETFQARPGFRICGAARSTTGPSRRRQRHRAGDRSADRRREMEVRDGRRDRHRHFHDGNATCSSPAGAKDICRRSTRAPARCCGRPTSARRC